MSILNSKVVWSEGIFITPQHFQQQERYFEDRINESLKSLQAFYYGVHDIQFDQNGLNQGIVKVNRLTAVLKDGRLVTFNERELAHLSITLKPNTKTQPLYLMIPELSANINEISFDHESNTQHRYRGFEKTVRDSTNIDFDPRTLMLANLNPSLMIEEELVQTHSALVIGQVGSNHNQEVFLDEKFIPPTLNSQKQPLLKDHINEVYGLLSQKSRNLAIGVNDPNRGGAVEIIDFLMLQTVNRYLAYLQHENYAAKGTHPETLFINLSKLCADLMTFLPERKMGDLPRYDHDDLATCFAQLMSNLRISLSTVMEQRIIRIPLERRDEATHVAQTPNKTLLDMANFILAAKADLPSEVLRQRVPSTMKISSVEKIQELIAYHLPGIKLNPLSVAPRELPYHSGYIYFELDKDTDMWQLFNDTSGMAFHLAGDFPNIDLEFWAIKPTNH